MTPSLGTSICHRCDLAIKEEKKKERERERERREGRKEGRKEERKEGRKKEKETGATDKVQARLKL